MTTPRPPAFVNDLETCVGCQACAIACANEHQLPPGTSWRQIVTFNEERWPGLPTFHLSLACNHCLDAPCLTACPAAAITRDTRTGAVLIADDACIGCRYCSWVCPYDAPRFDSAGGVMRKCTFCHARQANGLSPACVAACPVGALAVGAPVEGPAPPVSGFPETSLTPSIRFLPLRARAASADASAPRAAPPGIPPLQTIRSTKISARSEWTLVAFTLIAQALVGITLAAAAGRLRVHPLAVLLPGLAAITVSTMHLGQPLRAWRAITNVRSSWLSREIVSWSAFLALTAATLLFDLGPGMLWASAATGLACLVAVDQVYIAMARRHRSRLDDVAALSGGLYAAALAAGLLWPAVAFALWRTTAFQRRVAHAGGLSPRLGWVPLVRTILTAAGLWSLASGTAAATVGALVLAGAAELLDRLAFYDTLDVVTPRTQAARDLVAALR